MQRTLIALEFDKVLEKFSHYCISQSAKQKSLTLLPYLSAYGEEAHSLKYNQNLFFEAKDWLAQTHFKLTAFPELNAILDHLSSSHPFLDVEAFWAVKETLLQLNKVLESVVEHKANSSTLMHFTHDKSFPQELFEHLTRCISDNATIKDNASPALLLLRNELRSLNQSCTRKVKEAVSEYNIAHYLQDDYIALDSDRYVLPLKANFKGRLQGIIHHYSNTGETVFFEPLFLVEINNRIQELKQEEREEERKILLMLTSLLIENKKVLADAWNLLLDIDILLAKLSLADAYNGHCLVMQDKASFMLPEAKHPLLALEAVNNKKLNIRALDIHLREEERVLVISGGNAGGKTVCLKTAGLIILMTLAGLPVPLAQNASLPIIERVHAFIGDEQSLDDHVSTFTGQIRHLSRVFDELNDKCLVLLDEFGAGTDPAQGAALAQAVIDGMLEKKAYTLAATHFPALKTYALTHNYVRAASMLFEASTKKPIFSIAYDQVGASIALDVAREHGLPEYILSKAEQYMLVGGEDMSKIVDTLNDLAVQRKEELDTLKKEQAKALEKQKQVQTKFEQERRKLHDEVRELSRELMHAWKEGKTSAKQSMKEMAKLRASLVPTDMEEKKELSKEDLKIHFEQLKQKDTVQYLPWNKKALVLEVDAKNKKVKLDMNGVSLWASAKDISLSASAKSEENTSTKKAQNQKASLAKASEEMVRRTCDIRGKRADIAIIELETFLDKSLLNSVDIVEIVHGKGTGALRKSVHEYLRTSAFVSHFEKANEDQGGDGMTLAYLR